MGLGSTIGEAVTNLRRNGLMSLASAATVAISLFILAVFLLLAVNVDNLANTIESQIEIRVYLQADLPAEAREALHSEITALEGVVEVLYVSKEDALVELRQQLGPENDDLLEGVEDINPLRDSFRVFAAGPAWVDPIASASATLDGVEDVGYAKDLVQRLLGLMGSVRLGGLVLVGFMVIATLFVIANTVRLNILARSEEISIMRLVGATAWFIRWPFVLEGMLLGIIGAALAGVAAWQAYSWAVSGVYRSLTFMPVVPVFPLVWRLGVVLLAAGIVIGALGSAVSLRRFVRL